MLKRVMIPICIATYFGAVSISINLWLEAAIFLM